MGAPNPEDAVASQRVAVITGGKGDLARALAAALARDGWLVHAPGRDVLDVTDSEGTRVWFRDLGPCHLLIHNAGVTRDQLFTRATEDDWDVVLDTHLNGAARCLRAVLPSMLRQGEGAIITIGSFSALSGPVGQSNYAAAKAALIGLTQSIAREYGAKNVRANVVMPGFLETKMTRDLPAAVRERARAAHTLGRFTTPEESARFIAFLAGCPDISGQVFQLDSRIAPW